MSDVKQTPSNPTIKLKTKTMASKLADKSEASSVRSASPAATADDTVMSATASQAGEPSGETQRCKHCKQQVDKATFSTHSKACLRARKKKEKERQEALAAAANKDRDGDVTMGNGGDESIITATGENSPAVKDSADKSKNKKTTILDSKEKDSAKKTTNAKKRKADGPASSSLEGAGDKPQTKKQKKKEEAKAKAPKPKGPVDVEKQCGVLLPNGAMCARSLTCKSHAMGAKRAVPGRSMPYDMLLQNYQKKNQAKQQKAALASTAPMPDDLNLDAPSGPVDSDEEKEAVMSGVSRAAPRPLYAKPMLSTKAKYGHIRMKEMLAGALGGSRGSSLFSTAQRAGSWNMGNGERQGSMDAVGDAEHGMRKPSISAQSGIGAKP